MTITLEKSFFKDSIINVSQMIEEERDHLSHLDSEIGDGDHGINLSIGFREVKKNIDVIYDNTEDISSFLKKVGMTLLSKVGGASGPLYGSFFMKMGTEVTGKNKVTYEEFVKMIESGVESVEKRGKATVGQKTMIDALRPGINFLQEQNFEGDEVEKFEQYIESMKQGAENTVNMVAERGRSAILGERAVGHKDPGAESSWLIMNGFYEELRNRSKKI